MTGRGSEPRPSALGFLLSAIYSGALAPAHLADPRQSGLSDETIRLHRIRSVPPGMIGALLGFDVARIRSAMLIPFPDPRTGGFMRHARVKIFPALRKSGGHRVKYLQPRGSGSRLFFTLRTTRDVLEGGTPLWLVEGEKKALAAAQLGLPAVGFCGIEGWHVTRSRALLADFDAIRLAGRIIDAGSRWRLARQSARRAWRTPARGRARATGGPRPPRGAAARGGGVTKVGLGDFLVAGATARDLTALPRIEWWPSLAPHAMHGLAGRIVETVPTPRRTRWPSSPICSSASAT